MKYYYYFATHIVKSAIYSRLSSKVWFESLTEDSKTTINNIIVAYNKAYSSGYDQHHLNFFSRYINEHIEEFEDLIEVHGLPDLKELLSHYLGFLNKWSASSRSFGKNSNENQRAMEITEVDLINEMTHPKSSIKKLLKASGGDLNSLKPFLPALMISLNTDTRNRNIMKFKHTGRFCFDIDKLKDIEEARMWMNKLWAGTANIKPYMGFISPRGKGVKLFCQVDTSTAEFKKDFTLEERDPVMKHHKVWYEGARKEIIKAFPELEGKFDISTNDPQRLTYIPFITDKSLNFKFDGTVYSNYGRVIEAERAFEKQALENNMAKHAESIKKIMKDQNISSKEDAYFLFLKNKNDDFDLELETEKFIKTIDFIESLAYRDTRVENWVSEKFNDYATLQKLSWVLYGVFGDLAIDQIKRLIPPDSNKLDESGTDYRWAVRSKDDYDDNKLRVLTPGAFYALVQELGEVRDFLSENYRISSKNLSDFKLINDYYETYIRNKDLYEKDDDEANLYEFVDNVTDYIDKKKVRLPLIEELDTMASQVQLGESDYLNKDVMHHIFQNKYADKKIFCLRSQCGTTFLCRP